MSPQSQPQPQSQYVSNLHPVTYTTIPLSIILSSFYPAYSQAPVQEIHALPSSWEEIAVIIGDMQDQLAQRGWVKGSLSDAAGRVCLQGAYLARENSKWPIQSDSEEGTAIGRYLESILREKYPRIILPDRKGWNAVIIFNDYPGVRREDVDALLEEAHQRALSRAAAEAAENIAAAAAVATAPVASPDRELVPA